MKTEKDPANIKKDMMELWKATFHDSSRYIKLVFDTYFSLDNTFTVYDGKKLIAALLGIEYSFEAIDKYNRLDTFKGMYLCGLATLPEYRRRGIMTKLMNEAENSAKARGFDITFLIPADSHLRGYYQKKGYKTSSYKRCQMVDRGESENRSKMNIYTFQDFFNRGKIVFLREIAQWCVKKEKPNRSYLTLRHTENDFLTIMSENENSFFLTDSSFDPEYPILAKVRGVVFPTVPDAENRLWGIVGLYLRDNDHCISSSNIELRIPEEIREAIISVHPEYQLVIKLPYTWENISRAEAYAMVKSLRSEDKFSKYENQAYNISLMLD